MLVQSKLPLSGFMPVAYIAGPFRARRNPASQWEQFQNIRRAEDLALEAWSKGFAAICPHLNTMHFQGALPDYIWLEGDLEILRRVDIVLCCPNWELSTGAKAEVAEAERLGIPVILWGNEIPDATHFAARYYRSTSAV